MDEVHSSEKKKVFFIFSSKFPAALPIYIIISYNLPFFSRFLLNTSLSSLRKFPTEKGQTNPIRFSKVICFVQYCNIITHTKLKYYNSFLFLWPSIIRKDPETRLNTKLFGNIKFPSRVWGKILFHFNDDLKIIINSNSIYNKVRIKNWRYLLWGYFLKEVNFINILVCYIFVRFTWNLSLSVLSRRKSSSRG